MNPALAARLREAADWLDDDLPAGVPLLDCLEGDVTVDELDRYCVELMREAANALSDGALSRQDGLVRDDQ
jgi:hypothetical protein